MSKQEFPTMACKHKNIQLTNSSHALEIGYTTRSLEEIAVAAGLTDNEAATLPGPTTYPQPLVLPGDDLAWDAKWPEQSLTDSIQCMNRLDRRSGGRHVIYVAPPPSITSSSPKGMKEWTKLRLPKDQQTNLLEAPPPEAEDVLGYISAFYHGLPVKMLHEALQFTTWEDARKSKKSTTTQIPSAIGLQTSKETIRIRCRGVTKGPCIAQLNLNDLLDAAIAVLPKDAYALLMLIEHDLYEDEADDFCCGRAYGGSRIACVSMARYHPAADIVQDIDIEHAWPVSHCADYIERMTEAEKPPKKRSKTQVPPQRGPLRSAMDAYPKNLDKMTLEAYAGLWLGRFCRTASHELGHCFGLDHCLYYACVMQGTSSLAEDIRQPPYLCPVDLAKVLYTTGVTSTEHHQALLKYSTTFSKESGALFWTPFAAWLKGRLCV